ncbi:FAD-dependent oxidoreductase [Candidatus Saccharibacteria bacterium]|nr:FAD-dependent oxidoreductase [Candidatus Saccharibacteria bacterium]
MKQYDVIIVGAGIAGLTAGIYLSRAGKSVLVFESGAVGGQIVSAVNIENWPGDFRVSGVDLMERVSKQAVELGVEVRYEEVTDIVKNGDKFTIVTDEEEYIARAVVIATGTEPRKLDEIRMKEAGERTISYCATCDGALFKGKPVAVIGDGNTAKHEIQYLEGIASKVYPVHWEDSIPEEAVAVFVAIGRIPRTGFLKELVDLDEYGYVVAGEDCRTSCPGVFVAGDCRAKEVRQLVTASGDGAVVSERVIKYLGE